MSDTVRRRGSEGAAGEGDDKARGAQGAEAEVTLLDYLAVIWRAKWLITSLVVFTVVVAAVVTVRTPKVYEATTTLLLPREIGAGNLASFASNVVVQASGLGGPSLTPNRDYVLSVLKSRTIAETVVAKFDLQGRYKEDLIEKAVKNLQDLTLIGVNKESVVSVKVADTDPRLAAAMANYYVEEANRLIVKFGSGESSRQRIFIGEQLDQAKQGLEAAENTVRRFQEKNRAVVLQDQTRGALDAAARLRGEVMAAEVQLRVMRSFATDSNPEVISLKHRVDEMKRQLSQMQFGDGVEAAAGREQRAGGRQDMFLPFSKMPGLGVELARKTRDLKVQETLVTLLTTHYEQAKIAEAKDLPSVQVLDPAIPPVRHSRPSLRLNLLFAAGASVFVGVCLAFVIDYARRVRPRAARA